MKKIFEIPSLTVKEFRKENILTASGDEPSKTAEEKAAAALGTEVSVVRLTI